MKNICIVSRDRLFSRMLELELSSSGEKVLTVSEWSRPDDLKSFFSGSDLIVLDADSFDGDVGFISGPSVPVVVFSKNGQVRVPDNASFLERPFEMSELKNLVKNLFSHGSDAPVAQKSAPPGQTGIEFDRKTWTVSVNGETVRLTPKEFELLSLLYKNRRRTVSRREVLDSVWGRDYDEKNNVDNVYVNYIRKKLDGKTGEKLICTVHGKGYTIK